MCLGIASKGELQEHDPIRLVARLSQFISLPKYLVASLASNRLQHLLTQIYQLEQLRVEFLKNEGRSIHRRRSHGMYLVLILPTTTKETFRK